ncbi:hypothetical protein Golomagni_04928 [Golovinomyces magnicellulatus]|nr:hypothetical protein Golomagni_04928 [Golovinomyces magnicellulatus]
MLFSKLVMLGLAVAVRAQIIPVQVQNLAETTPPVSIATAAPSPDDIQHSLLSEASARVSSFSSVAASNIASITSSLGAEASQISSKLESVSSEIASKSSSYNSKYDPTNTPHDNVAAPVQTGAIAMGALFGLGAAVANL